MKLYFTQWYNPHAEMEENSKGSVGEGIYGTRAEAEKAIREDITAEISYLGCRGDLEYFIHEVEHGSYIRKIKFL